MAAPDTSFFPSPPGSAERPGVDEREHPVSPPVRSPDLGFDYLREMQRMIVEARQDGADLVTAGEQPAQGRERGGRI